MTHSRVPTIDTIFVTLYHEGPKPRRGRPDAFRAEIPDHGGPGSWAPHSQYVRDVVTGAMRGYYTNASGWGPPLTANGKPQREFDPSLLQAAATAAIDRQSRFLSATPGYPIVFKSPGKPLIGYSNQQTHYEHITLYTGGAGQQEEVKFMEILGVRKNEDGRFTLKAGTLVHDTRGTLVGRRGKISTSVIGDADSTTVGAGPHWMRPISRDEGSLADTEYEREDASKL